MNEIIKKANKLQEDCYKYYMETYGYGCDKYDLPELELEKFVLLAMFGMVTEILRKQIIHIN